MKNIKQFFILTLVFALFMGCSSNDDTTNDNNDSFYMRAKIDGVPYEVTGDLLCTYASIVTFNIQSAKTEGQEGITLTILPNNIAVQNYNMQQSTSAIVTGQYYLNDDSYTTQLTNEGSITIQEYNPETKVVKGVFSFKAKDLSGNVTKNITNGSFRCKGLN